MYIPRTAELPANPEDIMFAYSRYNLVYDKEADQNL
jgi:hypothetical protein